jgi:hypothetical protein
MVELPSMIGVSGDFVNEVKSGGYLTFKVHVLHKSAVQDNSGEFVAQHLTRF